MTTSGLPREALQSLYSDHHQWLKSWLRRRLGCAFDAADLTHDTYERLIDSNKTPQPEESRRWLARIANGLVIDLHRRRRLEIAYLDALAALPESQTPSAEVREIALETLIEIDAVLDKMSSRAREAFLLSRLDNLSYAEIAERLHVSVASVQKYMLAATDVCYSALDQRLESLPREVAKKTLNAKPPSQGRRRALRVLGALFVTGAVGYTAQRTPMWQRYSADHRTATGERLELPLPDSTRVVLGTASAIDLRFDDRVRQVVLRTGEVLVATAPDPAAVKRPFIVTTVHGRIRAIGTRFTVRQTDDGMTRVAVFEGAVMIEPEHASAAAVRIGAGQKVAFSSTKVHVPEAADETAAAWASGSLIVERMRLGEFVEELARYRPGLLRCDSSAADYLLTGVYPLQDTDRILASLEQALPVKVMRRSRYWVTITTR